MSAQAAVQQPAANAQDHAHDVRDPVVKVGASVEARLYKFNGPTEGARGNDDRQQTKPACARKREGQRREGNEVHQLVAAFRRRGRLVQRPEHRNGQGERHGDCQRNVEVLAHPLGVIDQ